MSERLGWSFWLVLILVSGVLGASEPQSSHNHGIRFQVLHHFTGGNDGYYIPGGLVKDRHGNLYGIAVTHYGGSEYGLLFELTRIGQSYKFLVLYNFDRSDGFNCYGTPAPDNHGNIFGVCSFGGRNEQGTLWKYSRLGHFTVLHNFTYADGLAPQDSIAVDDSGNIYGTSFEAGPNGGGTLWQYSSSSRSFNVLHGFSNGDDGGGLQAGPRIDVKTGVIWGTTRYGPNCSDCGNGTVWTYDPSSGIFSTVVDFDSTGILEADSRLILDAQGNVFGTAWGAQGVPHSCGVVYELRRNGNNYTPIILHQFLDNNRDGCSLYGRVRFDDSGNLLGTTYWGGEFKAGTVYKLKCQDGDWQEEILHSFDNRDGWGPQSGLKTDHKGNWFGTTSFGGKYNRGTVFQISGVQP